MAQLKSGRHEFGAIIRFAVWWRLLLAYVGTAAVAATALEFAMPGQAPSQDRLIPILLAAIAQHTSPGWTIQASPNE